MNNSIGQKLKLMAALMLVLVSVAAIGQTRASVYDDDKKRTYRNRTVGSDFQIEYKGDIELTDDDRDVKSISPGGYLEISKTTFGSKRYILIEAESGGRLYREYREGRTKVDWDPDGKEWLAEILPEVVRTTTLAAKSRVDRFYRQGGVGSVLTEISRIKSDYVQSHYFKILLDKDGLTTADLVNIAEEAAESISSDYYLSNVLKDHSEQFFSSDQATTAYLDAAREIGSDYYLSVVLKEALGSKELNEQQLGALLDATEDISSDYYVTTVLKEALDQRNITSERMKAIIRQSRNISSDHYQSELIKQIMEKDELTNDAIEIILDAIEGVGSDYYVYTLLTDILDRDDLSESVTLSIANRILNEISSDHYASEALKKLADKQLSSEGFAKVVEAAADINSDYYASKVLSEIAERDLSDDQLIKVIKAAATINSDYYLSTVLVAIADEASDGSAAVKDAYRAAADEISSETYYGRAMRALRN